jgi:hypothetical protein
MGPPLRVVGYCYYFCATGWHCCALFALTRVAIVPIGLERFLP